MNEIYGSLNATGGSKLMGDLTWECHRIANALENLNSIIVRRLTNEMVMTKQLERLVEQVAELGVSFETRP